MAAHGGEGRFIVAPLVGYARCFDSPRGLAYNRSLAAPHGAHVPYTVLSVGADKAVEEADHPYD